MPDTPRDAAQQPNGIILAFDFGLRRIGVAAGNYVTRSATALTTLTMRAGQPPWDDIDQLVKEWSPDLLVVGRPGDVGDTSIAGQATAFSDALAARYGIRVARVDEALTSRAASSQLAEARRLGQSRRRVDKAMIDRHAARIIAEQYLNSC
jgi:putative Holliday junction resolvase